MSAKLSFDANVAAPESRRAGLGDVTVTVRHIPTSTIFMLSIAEARAFAMCILKATDEAMGRTPSECSAACRPNTWADDGAAWPGHEEPTPRKQEPGWHTRGYADEVTRKQCAKCLKDCADCRCVVDRAGKGV